MSKYICSLLLFCWPVLLLAQDTGQVSDSIVVKKVVMNSGHQLRFSFDASKIVLNSLIHNKTAYEGAVDYYLGNEKYAVLELGAGNSNIDYPDLKYTNSNVFARVGMDKAMFTRKKAQDWGMAFIGFRYGVAVVKRNEAQYMVDDGLGYVSSGTVAAKSFSAHWIELCAGMRVELLKNTFAGWNVRFKFLLNQGSFGELKPAAIAGYGPGESGSTFDFNFYVAYALRWSSKHN